MKKTLNIILFTFCLFSSIIAEAQSPPLLLDSISNGAYSFNCGGVLYDAGGANTNYYNNISYWRTICPTLSSKRIGLEFESFDIHPSDRLEIYIGTSLSGTPILNNNNGQSYFTNQELVGKTIIAPYTEHPGCLTIRFVTDNSNTAQGFKANINCLDYAQNPVARLDTFFTKIDPQGNMHNFPIKDIIDTVYEIGGKIDHIDYYKSIDICMGDSIILRASPLFPENNMPYFQSSNTCNYDWSFGDGKTQKVYGNTNVGHRFNEGLILDLGLVVYDSVSLSPSLNNINTRIRISTNKITGVEQGLKICSGDVFNLSVGNQENNNVLIGRYRGLRHFSHTETILIPDGPGCLPGYVEVPIKVEGFPSYSTITNKDDILSICTNMEHSYPGDLSIEVICPNGQSTTLKYFTTSPGSDLGIPMKPDLGCDPATNPQGIGWNYCYSNQLLNNQRGVIGAVVSGLIIDSTDIYSQSGYFQTPIQNTSLEYSMALADLTGFETLVGCPINGEWNIKIADYWGADNGYIFSWHIEFSDLAASDITSFPPIDSTNLIGQGVTKLDDSLYSILMPIISPGTIDYRVEVIDDFGCVWDTIVPIRVLQGPVVDFLTNDTVIFEPITLETPYSEDYSYIWYPSFDTVNSITTPLITECDSTIFCFVMVSAMVEDLRCMASDYIQIHNNPTPLTPTLLEGHVNILEDSANNIEIRWLSNALRYDIYRDDAYLSTTTNMIYQDYDIIEGHDYCYTIKAINNYCESSISEPICKTAIGLNDISGHEATINLYPNPTSAKATLEVKGLKSKADIKLLDIQGRLIQTYTLYPNQESLEIDLSDLTKGLYNLRIDTKTGTVNKKIIKN